MRSIMKLYPALKDYLWGGQSLKEYFPTDLEKLSEAWVLSAHKDGKSTVIGGAYNGLALDEAIEKMGRTETLGEKAAAFSFFPVLIKLIDAAQNLSVQVHPDDEYALRVEGEYGKTEMWYVLDSKEGAGIYYGLKEKTSKEAFEAAIKNNTLTDLLEFVEAKKGDCFFIPSGTIHAIGAGLTIAEVQQNSNTTYRVYDYGRLGADGKPRALHVAKALDVTTLDRAPEIVKTGSDPLTTLASCPYFYAKKLTLDGTYSLTSDNFMHLLITDGEGTVNGEAFGKYDSFFVPAGMPVELIGEAEILISGVE